MSRQKSNTAQEIVEETEVASAPEESNTAQEIVEETEVASAPEETAPAVRGVRYIGSADVKILSQADLRRVGVEDPKMDLEFSAENQKFVSISKIDRGSLQYLETLPEEFQIVSPG